MTRRSCIGCIAVCLFCQFRFGGADGIHTGLDRRSGRSLFSTGIVINELNIAPGAGDAEFIELYNSGDASVDLYRLFIRDARLQPVRLTEVSRLLPPDAYVVLTRDSSAILDRFGTVPVIQVSPWASLNNGGDDIVISAEGETLDRVAYSSSWYRPGKSLERVDPRVPGIIRSNWAINDTETGASPGAVNFKYSPDTRSPHVLSAEYVDDVVVEVTFSESIDPASLPPGSLLADGVPLAQYELISPYTRLTFISDRPVSEFEVRMFADFAGNRAGPVKLDVARRATVHDIAITEIMFDPSPATTGSRSSPPEFVEMVNLTQFPLSLAGLFLEVGRTGATSRKRYPLRIPGSILKARSFAVLYAEPDPVPTDDPASRSSLWDAWPRDYRDLETLLLPVSSSSLGLVNTTGLLRLLREEEIPLDSVEYSSTWHDDRYAETRGRSIARIDPFDPLSDALRWTSTVADDGATPGESIRLAKNALDPGYGAVRLNEIMFDPISDGFDHRPDQPEYLEMFNLSSVPVDLNGIYLLAGSGERMHTDSIRLGYRPTTLPPGGYAVAFTLPGYVPDGDANALDFLRAAFPSFRESADAVPVPLRARLNLANDGKLLRLRSASGELQDEVWYRPEWHHFLVVDGSGSSLERIDAGLAPVASNWSTSTSASGGTPGRRNSVAQSDQPPPDGNQLEIWPKTFSPNGDGHGDTARIRMSGFRIPGAVRARIFDLYGRAVRTLSDFDFTTVERTLIWDGRDDSGRPLDTGIYIVNVQIIGPGDRKVESIKAAVALFR